MGAVGLLALTANVSVAALLYAWREGDANMRSVWLCSRNDAIGNLAVMLAALGVFGTGSAWPDLAVAAVMGSLEYGAYELEIPLLLVLGHRSCGAVQAAAEAVKNNAKSEGSMAFLVDALRPAVTPMKPDAMALTDEAGLREATAPPDPLDPVPDTVSADTATDTSSTATDTAGSGETLPPDDTGVPVEGEAAAGADPLTVAIKRSVVLTVKAVSKSAIIAERIRKDRLRVVGAFYDLETGLVELMENVPKQFLPQGASDTQA